MAKRAKEKIEQAQLNEEVAINEVAEYLEKNGEPVQPTIYSVTFNGTNVTSNGASTINENETYNATLTPATGYVIASMAIKMGDKTLVENTDYTYTNEKIEIPNVSGNIEINVVTNITTRGLKEGDYIKYNTGVASVGTDGVITCRVLYDASSEYGLQIISDKNVADVTLGGSTWTTAKTSYNNAIVTLNNEAEKYLNTAYATDARCVGSVPTINANGIFIEKDKGTQTTVVLPLSNWSSYTRPSGWTSNDTGCFDEDTNYITDKTQMTKESINIWTTGEIYWLATRSQYSDSFYGALNIQISNTTGVYYDQTMCFVDAGGSTTGKLHSLGLRPCFSLKFDINITGGDGKSEATAYTM